VPTLSETSKKREPAARHGDEAIRDAEVVRAYRELAAYFKGSRTEREARAALKIIKAFVRAREREDPRHRRPLPPVGRPKLTRAVAARSPSRRSAGAIAADTAARPAVSESQDPE
jgi:hypothetical protein